MFRVNSSDNKQAKVAKHWLKRIYIIEVVAALFLGLGCIWIFIQALAI